MDVMTRTGEMAKAVQMATPFAFKGRQYPAGSWIVLTPPRRAMTEQEYAQAFTTCARTGEWE